MNINELIPGSKLYHTKGAVRHVGVVLLYDRILHITPSLGVVLTDYHGFSQGHSVTHRIPEISVDYQAMEVRAQELLNNNPGYQWWAFNCEHLVSYVLTGKKVSTQLRAAGYGLVGHLILSEKVSVKGAAICVGLGLLGEWAMHSARKS